MAELATGAVSTLLGVIGHEALKLGRVRRDVQFIQEEMESMGSFLANLSGNSREHDEQVRTWMNQVRILATDCNSCIDLYLYRGNPALHRPKEGLGRCLWWAPWLLRKLVAQHRAAGRLRELKDRAQDIGNRRMRYGVEVKPAESSSSGAGQLTEPLLLPATQDHEEYDDYQHGGDPLKVALSMTSMRMDKEDYFQKRLDEWIGSVVKAWTEGDIERNAAGKSKPLPPSIAFVVPKAKDTHPLGVKIRDVAEDYFKRAKDLQNTVAPTKPTGADHKDAGNIIVFVDVPAVHYDSVPLRPHKILCYILAELERQNGPSHTQQHTHRSRWRTYIYTRITIGEINDKIEAVDVKAICNLEDDKLPDQDILEKLGKGEETHLDQLLRLLIYHSTSAAASEKDKKIKSGVAEWYDDIIKQTAKKLKQKIEQELREQPIRKIKEEMRKQLKRKIEEGGLSQELREQLKREIEEVDPSLELWEQLKRKIEEELRGQLKRKIEEGGLSPELQEQLKRNIEEVSSSPKLQEQLKRTLEEGGSSPELQEPEYEDILKTVFPEPTSITTTTTAANSPHGTSVDEEIKEMVRGVKEMLHQLHESDMPDENPEADIQKITEKKKKEIISKIRNRFKIKMMVQKIKNCLTGDRKILLILNLVYDKYVCQWEETRKSLSLLGLQCPITGAVIVATKTTQQDKKPQPSDSSELDHIEYSLAGLYLDNVLRNSGQHMDNDEETRQILRDILYRCESHEFSMKLFAHALYAKPKRSNGELSKLHKNLCDGATQKSLPSMMFKFSYMELPKEYRSCLLYLAIWPQGHTMRRSTLIGRWVAEGLITTKDWSWSSSVIEAEKCFDTLVARCLVCPAGFGATGKVKSCMVDKQVYGFITKIAMKQRILETRLSHHLARHFSIFSDVRLRRSETIKDFLKKSSEFSNLKVLDLEGCDCFPQNQHYLSHICRRILMLKYLSLRGTDVTSLPSEIHNLLELEVLDIRETKIPAHATRNILLPKLKRLLAGHVDSSRSSAAKPKNYLKRLLGDHVDSSSADFSSVQIPEKIEKMLGVEILSNVKVKKKRDLKDIAGLNELKKLGVVINQESHLEKLAEAISDLLNQSLRFLSVTLDITRHKGTPSNLTLKENVPNVLESLSINGSTITHEGKLLPLLTTNAKQLAKVTLTDTSLSQEDLQILAKLENLRCVKLRPNNIESKLTFNKDEFKNLKKILVEGTSLSEIKFENGAASNLEKIVFSSTNEISISGVDCLQKLEELELNNITNKAMLHSLLVNAKHITKVTLRNTLLEQGDLEILARERKIDYLALAGKFCDGNQLIFKECDFHKLNVLIVDSDDITEISFSDGSPNLEKIVWSFKNIVSLSGIMKLPALKELELNGDSVPNKVKEDIEKLKSRLDYTHRDKPKKQENKTEPDGAAKCPSLWKAKDWCWRN